MRSLSLLVLGALLVSVPYLLFTGVLPLKVFAIFALGNLSGIILTALLFVVVWQK